MDETDIYKKELAVKIALIISKEGLTDVTDWVEKNAKSGFNHNGVARSVAYILEATGDFQREELVDKTRYYVKRLPTKTFKDKHPTRHDLFLIAFAVGLGLVPAYFQNQWQNDELKKDIKTTSDRVEVLSDSLENLRDDINNSGALRTP
jgi:hypothetical protein